jgi:hypothetical protein
VTVPDGTVRQGHIGATILLLNSSPATCDIRGFPGVAGLNRNGAQVAQARWTVAGYLGGIRDPANQSSPTVSPPLLPTVTLQPGQYASATVEALDADASRSCLLFPALLITPPDSTASIRIPVLLSHVVTALPDCGGFEVHPVTPGFSGSQGSPAMVEIRAGGVSSVG